MKPSDTKTEIHGPCLQKFSDYIAEFGLLKDHKPSWKRFGEGHLSIKAERHIAAEWVQFVISEVPKDGNARTVMFSLDAETCAILGQFLMAKSEELKALPKAPRLF